MIANNPGIKLVIIDYLQLISSTTNKDRHIQVAEMSRGLKLLARELNIAIVALSQLNRSLENRADKRPILSDLRESGSIEQDADLILFIYREDVYKQQEEKQKAEEMKKKGIPYQSKKVEQPISDTELIIGKQRNGPLGVVKLHFIKENASFREKFDRKTDSNIEIEFA
jgi:replicative DNA helicase